MVLATVCVAARATTTNPSEKIVAMASTIERMKNGTLTWSGAPKITVPPTKRTTIAAAASTRLKISCAASSRNACAMETRCFWPPDNFLNATRSISLAPRESSTSCGSSGLE